MELRTLRYFLEIAAEKNMTVAAANLHVSQSALSHQMRELEAELNAVLFERTNRQTLLTEDGRRLRARAEAIISLVDSTEDEFLSSDEKVFGLVRIGAGESSCLEYFGRAAVRLREKHPGITFNIFSAIADDISDRMDKGLLDFALYFEPVSHDNLEYIEVPVKHIGGLLVRDDSPLAEKDFVTREDVESVPLIISSRQNSDEGYIAGVFGIEKEKMNVVASGNLTYNKAMLVRSGLGCVLSSDAHDFAEGSGLKFLPLKPGTETSMIFAWRKGHRLTKAAELFLEELKKEFALIRPE